MKALLVGLLIANYGVLICAAGAHLGTWILPDYIDDSIMAVIGVSPLPLLLCSFVIGFSLGLPASDRTPWDDLFCKYFPKPIRKIWAFMYLYFWILMLVSFSFACLVEPGNLPKRFGTALSIVFATTSLGYFHGFFAIWSHPQSSFPLQRSADSSGSENGPSDLS